ncbi:hypothetical protein SAPIO_CDS1880 [Scedosporium apiospermum]|uniref:Small secreted protein n=1 Tax=Pseudallescheria apiosperma TaxID=563466 RepID=A0A084GDY4_PSEDA|nr:uncharacterized protein SAPIO_CDS1880 [Scedosporium apiospermum]KEZ45546.1 hypothetical protein SAPIO_CDS1880 [Scedosporium apiospermum]
MHFSKITFFTFVASVLAVDLLTVQDYADFQISDGVAGNALAEVAAKFPVEEFRADLAAVSENDLAILKAARETAEDAETESGGFNDAIDAAGGKNTEEGAALQIGKIKNKVLKLELFSLVLQIEQAQGADNQDKLDEELAKLAKNVATDEDSAGETSQSVNFQGSSQP